MIEAQLATKRTEVLVEQRRGTSWLLSLQVRRLILFAAILFAWEYASGRWVDPFWVSSPSAVFAHLWLWIEKGTLYDHVYNTLLEALIGFAVGGFFGLAVGFLLGWWKPLADLLDPFIIAAYSLPKVALAPLFILWFGIGLLTKIVLVAVIVFFLVFYNSYAGVREVDRELVDIIRLMGANTWGVIRRVVLPSALSMVFIGLRVSVPYALIGAVVGEMMASNRGLGYLIMAASSQFNTAGVFAALLVLVLVSMTLNELVVRIEGHLLRWKHVQR